MLLNLLITTLLSKKLSKDKNIEQKYRKKDGTLIKISSELLRLTLRLEVGDSCFNHDSL